MLAALAVAIAGWASTKTFAAHHPFSFLEAQTPAAAVDVLKQRQAQRIFSTAPFGGYLLSRDIKTFIDGRAELFGEQFLIDSLDAVEATAAPPLLPLPSTSRIASTLPTPP